MPFENKLLQKLKLLFETRCFCTELLLLLLFYILAMGGCTSSLTKLPSDKKFRRAIKLYEVEEVYSLTNLFNRNKCFENGESPLTLAAQEGHEAVVEALVSNGADVNKLDRNGRGALHLATHLNDEQTVDILLKSHADPCKLDEYHSTTPLHIACERGFHNIAERLIQAGANVNDQGAGLPPLIFAITNRHQLCVEDSYQRLQHREATLS